ncbi:Ltp family lipoprotein [Collinsella sp. D33t1_170424_A12]|uniref:Ltp family lipoprotein n=1 Tax=Collinsella sp. D33t1_170424_A12 TaxID=2787135 RepID=UPI001898B0A7|nr:Ltp family lipoprotein [Collinsella sp. D33t1_170424_A12]
MAKDGKTPIWKIVLVVFAVLLVLGAIGSMGGNQPATSEPADSTTQPAPVEPEPEPEPDVPTEYKSALRKAESYSEMMHMSKQGIYDQLTSEYGEKFSPEAAQYAIDNLQADYNANALAKAQSYQDDMNMSPEAIRDQLTSEYGEKFTQEEADYAVANLG